MQLLLEKGYESITVQDILDRANIGRSTFYAHYFDKADVLESIAQQMLADFVQQAHQAFANHTVTIDDLIAEGDKVAAHISYTATAHQAQFGKNPPTGQPVQLEAMIVFHFEQGKVVEIWAVYQGIDLDVSP